MTEIRQINPGFDLESARRARDEWGFSCGPAALCALLDKTPNELRPHLGDFERKRYTNPSLMADILRGLKVPFRRVFEQTGRCHRGALKTPVYPSHGLVRIQWDGRWCDSGVPARVRYRHTHWIASTMGAPRRHNIFDVNAMSFGGWLSFREWSTELVPRLLKHMDPKATGEWWPTHCWEIGRKADAA